MSGFAQGTRYRAGRFHLEQGVSIPLLAATASVWDAANGRVYIIGGNEKVVPDCESDPRGPPPPPEPVSHDICDSPFVYLYDPSAPGNAAQRVGELPRGDGAAPAQLPAAVWSPPSGPDPGRILVFGGASVDPIWFTYGDFDYVATFTTPEPPPSPPEYWLDVRLECGVLPHPGFAWAAAWWPPTGRAYVFGGYSQLTTDLRTVANQVVEYVPEA